MTRVVDEYTFPSLEIPLTVSSPLSLLSALPVMFRKDSIRRAGGHFVPRAVYAIRLDEGSHALAPPPTKIANIGQAFRVG
jgi:hypothetical protein